MLLLHDSTKEAWFGGWQSNEKIWMRLQLQLQRHKIIHLKTVNAHFVLAMMELNYVVRANCQSSESKSHLHLNVTFFASFQSMTYIRLCLGTFVCLLIYFSVMNTATNKLSYTLLLFNIPNTLLFGLIKTTHKTTKPNKTKQKTKQTKKSMLWVW